MFRVFFGAAVLLPFICCGAMGARVEADGSGDYATIQEAIEGTDNGGVVVLGEGVYRGQGNRDLDTGGKAITIRSERVGDPNCVESTVIDCEGSAWGRHRGFVFNSGEGSDTVIRGLTIRRGFESQGGAIYVGQKCHPTIDNCILENNRGDQGGAIYLASSMSEISNCVIWNNNASESGGGIFFENRGPAAARVKNCLIVWNTADRDGGAVSADFVANVVLSNCTICDNVADGQASTGGGVYSSYMSEVDLVDSILWSNRAAEGWQVTAGVGFEPDPVGGHVGIYYCDIEGGVDDVNIVEESGATVLIGDGLISEYPGFVSGMWGGYYLPQTAAGQGYDSPCVDSGSKTAQAAGMDGYTTRTDSWFDSADGGVVDMGYHYPLKEFVIECKYCDLLLDGVIDLADVAEFALAWTGACVDGGCLGSDLDLNGVVDLGDMGILAGCWMVEDQAAPEPNTATWVIRPRVTGPESTDIEMSARVSKDYWLGLQVEYFFECLGKAGVSSGWRQNYDAGNAATYVENPEYYLVSGLEPDTNYAFRVRVRDRRGNVTEDSDWGFARTGHEMDAPTPDPSQWEVKPRWSGDYSVIMEAVASNDENGPVEYYFRYTDIGGENGGNDDGHDSGWQSSPVYEDRGLTPGVIYHYRVSVRDAFGNVTSESAVSSTDHNAPVPNPPLWDPLWPVTNRQARDGSYWQRLIAQPVVDLEGYGVEYRFECREVPSLSSGWRSSDDVHRNPDGNIIPAWEYWAPTNTASSHWQYIIHTRDQSVNQNTSKPSDPEWHR